jgi:type I restriction enzyme M protein
LFDNPVGYRTSLGKMLRILLFLAEVVQKLKFLNNSILTPGRYVGIEEQDDDDEPFEAKMARLTDELSQSFKRSRELEKEIRKRLGAIGYEI